MHENNPNIEGIYVKIRSDHAAQVETFLEVFLMLMPTFFRIKSDNHEDRHGFPQWLYRQSTNLRTLVGN